MQITIEIEERDRARILEQLGNMGGIRIVEPKRTLDEILPDRIEEYLRHPERFADTKEKIEELRARIAKRCIS